MLQPIQLKLTSNQRLINGVAFRWPSPLGGFDMFVKRFLQPQTVKVLLWCSFFDHRDSRWRSNRFCILTYFKKKMSTFFTQTLNMLWNWTSSEVQLKHTNFRGLTKQPLYLQWSPWEHRPLDRLDSKPSPCPWSPNPPWIFLGSDLQQKKRRIHKVSSPFQGVSSPFQGGKSLQKFMSFGICKLRCSWPYRLGRSWGHGYPECIPNCCNNQPDQPQISYQENWDNCLQNPENHQTKNLGAGPHWLPYYYFMVFYYHIHAKVILTWFPKKHPWNSHHKISTPISSH